MMINIRCARPLSAPPNRTDEDMHAHAEWQRMLDTGLIIDRNPPPAPDVIATREANDRLFSSFPYKRPGAW